MLAIQQLLGRGLVHKARYVWDVEFGGLNPLTQTAAKQVLSSLQTDFRVSLCFAQAFL